MNEAPRPTGLATEAQFLKGVGPKLAMSLAKLGLKTVGDVLTYFPRRYEDRTNLPPIRSLVPGQAATIRGRISDVRARSTRGGQVILTVAVEDGSGVVLLTWFNQPWVTRELQKVQGEIIAFGMVKEGRDALEMVSPEWEPIEDDDEVEAFARITPVYPLRSEVRQWVVRKAAHSAIEYFASQAKDPLPEPLRNHHQLRALAWCLRQIHQPEGETQLAEARRRLAFEEFLALQVGLQMRRAEVQQEVGIAFDLDGLGVAAGGNLFAEAPRAGLEEEIRAMLPFELTGAQRRVIREIWDDMRSPSPMNRLVQGDVGSGKTAVAACAMLAAVRCGYQAALMAPTEILAEQHYINLHRLFDPLGIQCALLVGKLGAKDKRKALDRAAGGEAQVAIGTHALVQDGVKFAKLGLAVIDEQHRFGVLQRAALRKKGLGNPDVLVMTATPIPRTLTMSLYGDLDLSVIDELPPGRRPIKTHWKRPGARDAVYAGVRKLLDEGRQAYFVCPMISESEKMQTQAAEDLYYRLSREEFKDLPVGLLHGQMKPQEKEQTMLRFRQGEIKVLVSTVVIEVGVDVPNASVMVIEDAYRFGLSQLHQLRGRVGRGAHQSYCILVSDAKTEDAQVRMEVMVRTTDGFVIAEEDLKLRGPGDVAGTRQSGTLEFKVADLLRDGKLLEEARGAAIRLLQADPGLRKPEHAALLDLARARWSEDALITVS